MLCSISGTVPEEPVVDRNTGDVFEKRLIHKYVKETGNSPVTGESLSIDDLLPLKSSQAVKPRPAPATSIPGLISLFNNEWDAVMLEVFALRKELGAVRQELSQALYQHDASVRVIARLQREVKERDELLAKVGDLKLNQSQNGNSETNGMDSDSPAPKKAKAGLGPEVIDAVTKLSQTLSSSRKKRQLSNSLATVDELKSMSLGNSYPLHKTTQGGILAIDTNPTREHIFYTVGNDHMGKVYDRQAGRIMSTLKGHTKRVNDIKVIGNDCVLVTASADKTARVWRRTVEGDDESYKSVATLKDHTHDVSSIAVHATLDYFITSSLDKSWCFYDVATTTCLQQPVAKMTHSRGQVTSLCFSENGYHMACAAGTAAKVFDLRKLSVLFDYPTDSSPGFVTYDHSGQFLAVGHKNVDVLESKKDWSLVKTFMDLPRKGAYSGRWGVDAKSLLIGSADHNLRVYAVDEATPME